MDNELSSRKPHVLLLPYPAQGHINPALAFANCLSSKGIIVTVIITTSITKKAKFSSSNCSNITVETISDGSEEVLKENDHETIEGYFKRLRSHISSDLVKFIDQQKSCGLCPKLIVYDSSMPWVLDIAHEKGLLGASFFTQSCSVCAVYYHLRNGSIDFPYEEDCRVSTLPGLPTLGIKDLPSFKEFDDANHTIMNVLADQFLNLDKVDWIFFNSFDKLEIEVVEWMRRQWPIKTIGPAFSLLESDDDDHDDDNNNNKLPNNKNHMVSLFEPNHEACMEWLDSRETDSVIYISFGSIASLGKEHMEELAWGLITSNCHFLWVVRASEVQKLPQDFTSLASEKGLIVNWCHQPQVLAHSSVACFMTHCGWNSTLEALSYGVRLIAMAQWVDQLTNAKFVEDVWGVGVRVKAGGENGIISREEIAMCIREVTQGDKGMELKRNACKWKDLAREAVGKGGTSANNIQDFVESLIRS